MLFRRRRNSDQQWLFPQCAFSRNPDFPIGFSGAFWLGWTWGISHPLQFRRWTVGQNVQIDYRWSAGSEDDTRKYAAELVALAPDVIFASGTAAVEPLRRATRTVPIVFVLVPAAGSRVLSPKPVPLL
jgi:hypothetical protein